MVTSLVPVKAETPAYNIDHEEGDIPENNWAEALYDYLSSGSSDDIQDVAEEYGVPDYEVESHDPGDRVGAGGGEYIVVDADDLDPDDVAGTTGAGPCIAVIVYDGDTIYVFHFNAQSDVNQTLGEVLVGLGEDATVYIAGGDGTDGSDQTLENVITYFEGMDNVDIGGIIPSVGIWIDGDGNLSCSQTELNLHTEEPEPTLPPADPQIGEVMDTINELYPDAGYIPR